MAIQRVAQIALAGGLLIAGIAAFKGCQQTARLNRPVATEGIPEGHEYLMRTNTGTASTPSSKAAIAQCTKSQRAALMPPAKPRAI